MKVYIDTGVFLDYLATNSHFSTLDQKARRGRTIPQLKEDAENCLLKILRQHNGMTSCLTSYEVESLLFKKLDNVTKGIPFARKRRIQMARLGVFDAMLAVQQFSVDMVDLTVQISRRRLRDTVLSEMESADALHATTAIMHDAEIIISSDKGFHKLDSMLNNLSGVPIRCVDTDTALTLL